MGLVKHVWKNRDNDFVLLLESVDADGIVAPVDGAVVTSVLMELENGPLLTVVKDTPDASINWWDAGLAAGEMQFKLGAWAATSDVSAANYRVRITLYSLNAPQGIVWVSFAKGELALSVHAA